MLVILITHFRHRSMTPGKARPSSKPLIMEGWTVTALLFVSGVLSRNNASQMRDKSVLSHTVLTLYMMSDVA